LDSSAAWRPERISIIYITSIIHIKDLNIQIRIFCLFSGACEINSFFSRFSPVFVYLEAGACEVEVPIACAQCLEAEEEEEAGAAEEEEKKKEEEEVSRKNKRGSGYQ
jgi:hypothetical protein